MQPQFTKFHGLGNDYLVFEAEKLDDIEDLGDFARRVCNRHYGAGGDGIAITIRKRPMAFLKKTIISFSYLQYRACSDCGSA